ncbi:MAG: hypothetical protein ACOC90_03340 [Bacteroidota bacterium]
MSKLSPDKYFKSLSLLYISFIFGQLILMLIVLFLRTERVIELKVENERILELVVPLFTAGGIHVANTLYRKSIRKARGRSTLDKKLTEYRLGLILRYLFWVAPSLLAIVSYFLTGNWLYLAISGVVLVVFLANPPGMEKAKRDLDL